MIYIDIDYEDTSKGDFLHFKIFSKERTTLSINSKWRRGIHGKFFFYSLTSEVEVLICGCGGMNQG